MLLVKQWEKRYRDLKVASSLPLPDIQCEDTGARLQQVAKVTEQMCVALGKAIGTLWWGDRELRSDLGSVMELLQWAPNQLLDWQLSAAFEGARQVLAGVGAHHMMIPLAPLVREAPGGHSVESYFEEVADEAKYAAGACELKEISLRYAGGQDDS